MTSLNLSQRDPSQHALPAELLHDLRTQLNHIIGYSEMLAERAEEEGPTGFVPDLEKIQAAGRRLLDLVNNGTPVHRGAAHEGHSQSGSAPGTFLLHPQATTEQSAPDGSQGQLLVVDDNGENRDVLARRLEQMGYAVSMAENGRDAMAAVRAREFDLVLLDIMMPEVDGYQVLEQLKADGALRHIPVVMISASDESDDVARCIRMGAEDYLPKPFNPTLLKARVSSSLEKKRARDREIHLFGQTQQDYVHLQELEKLRDDLTHMIIHDLRTPLTSLITGIHTLEVLGDLNRSQKEMMGIAIIGGETLLGMINDLLDVEKLESGTMQLDYDLLLVPDLVGSAIHQIASLAQDKQLTIVRHIAADLPPLLGDASKLRRTLVNLLGNAIKFTPSGGTVTVGVHLNREGQGIHFSVCDTGEGIPQESFGRIFEKFGQVESRKCGRKMSTGLGLTLCKLVVESHGGHIQVQSVPEQGSTFCFTIPLPSQAD